MADKATLTLDMARLRRSVDEFGDKVDGYVHAVCSRQGDRALSFAKTNARWTDRTANARNGLSLDVLWEPMAKHVITIFHRVPYGYWLETRWAGKYAIIIPTVREFGVDTMRVLNKMFRRIRSGEI